MKNFIIIFFAALVFFSCEESEFLMYEAQEGGKQPIKFHNYEAGSEGEDDFNAWRNEIDSTSFSFVFEDPNLTGYQFPIAVKISGESSPNDRTFRLEADESSIAEEGVHYSFPESFTIKKNQFIDTVYVTLLKHASLKDDSTVLKLNIIDGGDFVQGADDKQSFSITFADKVQEPAWWGANYFQYRYGGYSGQMHRVLVIVSGVVDHSIYGFNSLEEKEWKTAAKAYIADPANHDEFDWDGDQVLDENGNPIIWS